MKLFWQRVAVMAAIAVLGGSLWSGGAAAPDRGAPEVATRYHARNRTSQFFRRSATTPQAVAEPARPSAH